MNGLPLPVLLKVPTLLATKAGYLDNSFLVLNSFRDFIMSISNKGEVLKNIIMLMEFSTRGRQVNFIIFYIV